MAATIARAQDPSAIADTMPTTEMSSDDATDGVHTTAAGDASPRLQSAQKPVNSGTGNKSFAADVVFGPHRRFPSRARKQPSLWASHPKKSQTSKKSVGKGSTATKSKKQTSKKSVGEGSTATKTKKKAAVHTY